MTMHPHDPHLSPKAIARELKTVEAMIEIYCRHHHTPSPRAQLCPDCTQLLQHATLRLSKCPFKENKPACKNCRIHCYREPFKSRIREVMRYSGPRMLLHHPFLACRHLIVQQWVVRKER
ncbi:MAG: nitrous oxide-stimulated promoter family protein [Verrucomicrobiota bacterium]|nr:nitrous oxide-stimulated promoter family protein [Verrucomicrobiota bacterium]